MDLTRTPFIPISNARSPFLAGALAFACLPLLADDALPLPEIKDCQAQVSTGSGSGSMSVENGLVKLQAKVSEKGDYAENWKMKAAVFDWRLPSPLPLSVECARLSLQVNCQYEMNKGSSAMIRALVKDSRGGEWAVATKLLGGGSKVPFTRGFEQIETYDWDISEIGRIDPWVMTSLDPAKFDAYDAPKPPLSLVGFRLIETEGDSFALSLRNVSQTARGSVPDPYWCVSNDEIYSTRFGKGETMRYGWGPDQAGPFLRAYDLGLQGGSNRYSWELLSADESKTLASSSGDLDVSSPSSVLPLPLLPDGTYRLRLFVKGQKESEGKSFYFEYFVVRNSRPSQLVDLAASPKPLSASFNGGSGGVFEPGSKIELSVKSALPGSVKWTVESCDRRKLLEGDEQAGPGKDLKLDLTELASKEASLWISATLLDGKTELDRLDRAAGYKTAPAKLESALGGPAAKLEPLASSFRRTKGDWHEGGTSIAIKHAETMEQMKGWLDEALWTGYNIVELSAPWYDLEPLPGVYHFEYLDRLVKEAESRGFRVVLRSHPINGQVPGWVPREMQEDQSFRCHGIWGGGSNLIYSPASEALRSNYHRFLEALSEHYRSDASMLGYTLTNVFFDHSMIDNPWLGQHVDCSASMLKAYAKFLKAKYGSLAALSKAHGFEYASWESVKIPSFSVAMDQEGRVRPPSSKAELDYAECKKEVLCSFRTEAMAALRKGDPACVVGPYSDQARAFLEQTFSKEKYFVPQGSMEDQFPPEPLGYLVRYEPHAKVSRLALTTDIGVSNLAFHKLGWNELYNYWFPNWRLDSVTPDIKEAEARLKQWFAALDSMKGAKELASEGKDAGRPAVVGSLDTLIYSWKHVHTSRVNDYVNQYLTRASAEKVRSDLVFSTAVTPASLEGRPYVYLPFSSDALDKGLQSALASYVENGGKLIMEWSSGYWTPGEEKRNSLGSLLGLPDAKPVDLKGKGESVEASVEKGSPVEGAKLSFRVKEFNAPIDTQPVPWVHCAARSYYRLCEIAGGLPAGAVLAATAEGRPAAFSVKKGKGEILFFAGTVDWLSCPGLVSRIDAWGKGREFKPGEVPSDPEALVSCYGRDGKLFAIGRRFIHHSLISKLKGGKLPDECVEAKPVAVAIPAEEGAVYSVKELLSGKDLGSFKGKDLKSGALELGLRRGEAFVVEATPKN